MRYPDTGVENQGRLPCEGEAASSGARRSFSHIHAPETVGIGVATGVAKGRSATGFATARGGAAGLAATGAGETAASAVGFAPGIHSRNGFPQARAISPAATTSLDE